MLITNVCLILQRLNIYTSIYRRLGGLIGSADPNREIGFGFVSCSCRACERAGEAKLRGRVGDDASSRWWL